MDAGSNNWKEREGNYLSGMDRQGRMEKENTILRTERCENVDTLYINIKMVSNNLPKREMHFKP